MNCQSLSRQQWPIAQLGEIIDLFDYMREPLNSEERRQRQGPYPYYGAQGIIDHIDDFLFNGRYILVAEDGENLNSRKLPVAQFADGKFWVNNHAHILRGKPNLVDDTFLLASLNHIDIRPFVTGAAQPKLSQANLKIIEISLPPMAEQRCIAEILSAYDDLIENNQRRIKILEEMARSLYREWFIRGNFPAQKEGLSFQEGMLGDLCALVKRPFSEQLHANRPLLDLSRMPQRSIAPGDTGPASELTTSRILFEPGDTLFGAIRCYLHKVNAAHFSGVTNTSVLVLRPKIAAFRSLVAIIASDTETIRWADTHSAGTKMPVINWGVLQTMPAPTPSSTLAKRFEAAAGPMMDQIGILATEIQNLRQTRDLLLPRLLTVQAMLREV